MVRKGVREEGAGRKGEEGFVVGRVLEAGLGVRLLGLGIVEVADGGMWLFVWRGINRGSGAMGLFRWDTPPYGSGSIPCPALARLQILS